MTTPETKATQSPPYRNQGVVLYREDLDRVAQHRDALKARGMRGVNLSSIVRAALAQFDPARVEGSRL